MHKFQIEEINFTDLKKNRLRTFKVEVTSFWSMVCGIIAVCYLILVVTPSFAQENATLNNTSKKVDFKAVNATLDVLEGAAANNTSEISNSSIAIALEPNLTASNLTALTPLAADSNITNSQGSANLTDTPEVATENLTSQVQNSGGPLTINGDTVEYSTDKNEFSASGNVEILYKETKLSCDKITVNTLTKDGSAVGHIRLDDKSGVILGEKLEYNFDKKTGVITDAAFRAYPYFGKGEKIVKVSDEEFVSKRGYFTSCGMDIPHWRIKSKKIDIYPENKLVTKENTLFFGSVPVMHLPMFVQSLKDPIMHVQVSPGKKKEWGAFVLSAWRYKINDNVGGNIFFDVRQKLGNAQGFETNYKTKNFGKGDFKFYYAHEVATNLPMDTPNRFQRYLIRYRHKWDIDDQTNMVGEYFKIVDSKRVVLGSAYNILKDYFYREYEKDAQPLSYVSVHRSFGYSSMDFLLQPRTNRWYSQIEKLPEITYSMPSLQLGETPLYLQHTSSFVSLNQKLPVPSPSTADIYQNKLDTTNRLSLPSKVAFIEFTPFVSSRQTLFDRDSSGASMLAHPRTIFSGGADMSTKFYRLFDVKTNFMKLHLDGLRHVITPTASYLYQHEPTVKSSILSFEPALGASNSIVLGLSNKLQTKREKAKVDLADFRISNTYNFKTGDGNKQKGNLSDFLFQLDLLPYSWMSMHADATYSRSGVNNTEVNQNYNKFSQANFDINFSFAPERSFGIGQRYQRKGGNEVTYNIKYRLNPKWMLALYQRYHYGKVQSFKPGIWEQEYVITRDLHCWVTELVVNQRKGSGTTIMFVFRLKAFPEMNFNINQTYNSPRPGAQQP